MENTQSLQTIPEGFLSTEKFNSRNKMYNNIDDKNFDEVNSLHKRSSLDSTNLIRPSLLSSSSDGAKLLSKDSGIESVGNVECLPITGVKIDVSSTISSCRLSSTRTSSSSSTLNSSGEMHNKNKMKTSDLRVPAHSLASTMTLIPPELLPKSSSLLFPSAGPNQQQHYQKQPPKNIENNLHRPQEILKRSSEIPHENVNDLCNYVNPKLINKKDGLRYSKYVDGFVLKDESIKLEIIKNEMKKEQLMKKQQKQEQKQQQQNHCDNDINKDVVDKDKRTTSSSLSSDDMRRQTTMSCVSWTRICKKFKNILSK